MKKLATVILVLVLSISTIPIATAQTLQERIEALEARVAALEAMVGISSDTIPTDDTGDSDAAETGADEAEATEPVLMTTQQFIDDIVASYNARAVVADNTTNAEQNAMTTEEKVYHLLDCANAEKPFFDKYINAVFDDLNIQYLCKEYLGGLTKQYKSLEVWKETSDYEKFYDQYHSGYYNRAYVIVELSEYYDAPFSDISGMKSNTRYLDSTNAAEKRNAKVDRASVKKCQELLNSIGFFCGSADGVAGKRTVKSIKRFQEMYGYEPIDGMIDEELIGQLEAENAVEP